MRATLAATYLDRGRVADAGRISIRPSRSTRPSWPPTCCAASPTRASTGPRRLRRRMRPRESWSLASVRASYLYLSATRETARSGERGAALEALVTAVRAGASAAAADDFAGVPIDLLDDASVDAPLFVPAAYVAGFRLLAQARYPEALASLRAAAAVDPLVTSAARPTALNPADERARISKADALVASGDRAAARASLLDTVRRLPDSGLAHWRLGRLAEDDADQAAALRSYEAASRCAPVAGASIVHAAIGRLQHTVLDLDAAARSYERRVTLAPRSAPAHLDLGKGVSGAGSARRRAGRVPGGGAARSRQRERARRRWPVACRPGGRRGRDRAAAARRAARRQSRGSALRARPGAAAGGTRGRITRGS